MCDLMLRVENVSKEYRLGAIGGTTLREEIQRKQAKLLRKEDPTTILGQERTNEKGMFLALSNISFEVKKGEALGIIGHNGAGKSTLLKLITQVTAPTSGTIYLNGRVASMLEVGTGFHPELTGRENIYVNGAILGMTKREIDSKIEEIINFSECRQFIDTPVKRYSSGMYVKLAFSVAANLESEIMIMDEVLAVGDVAFQNKCISKMRDVAGSGRTILYVSHNMTTIRSLCNRCIVLSNGKIDYIGDVEEAIGHYISTNFDLSCEKNLSAIKRPYSSTQEAIMQSVTILDKDTCVFEMGEMFKFSIQWLAKRDFSAMKMRIGVWSVNGHAVGISFSESFSGKPDQINTTVFSLDISLLLPGKYSLELIMNEIDQQGTFAKHDVIKNAVMFEIVPSDDKQIYNSYNSSWGYCEMPAAKIIIEG